MPSFFLLRLENEKQKEIYIKMATQELNHSVNLYNIVASEVTEEIKERFNEMATFCSSLVEKYLKLQKIIEKI